MGKPMPRVAARTVRGESDEGSMRTSGLFGAAVGAFVAKTSGATKPADEWQKADAAMPSSADDVRALQAELHDLCERADAIDDAGVAGLASKLTASTKLAQALGSPGTP